MENLVGYGYCPGSNEREFQGEPGLFPVWLKIAIVRHDPCADWDKCRVKFQRIDEVGCRCEVSKEKGPKGAMIGDVYVWGKIGSNSTI